MNSGNARLKLATIAVLFRSFEERRRDMKRDIPTQVGIGFTILVASATFLVAVMAGLFLIWQPDASTLTQRAAQSPQISLAAQPAPQSLAQ